MFILSIHTLEVIAAIGLIGLYTQARYRLRKVKRILELTGKSHDQKVLEVDQLKYRLDVAVDYCAKQNRAVAALNEELKDLRDDYRGNRL